MCQNFKECFMFHTQCFQGGWLRTNVFDIEQHFLFELVSWYTGDARGWVHMYVEGLVTIKSLNTLITWSCKVTWANENYFVSTTRVTLTTKLCRMVSYLNGLLPIKSHEFLITWSCETTWKTKTIISIIPQCLWPPNLVGWWVTLSGNYLKSYSTFWSLGLARSRDKLKPLNLRYYRT